MGKIKVTINGVGEPTIETEGFTGSACKTATEALEQIVSGSQTQTTSDDKPEMFEDGNGQIQENTW
jgi:hypothetical protein